MQRLLLRADKFAAARDYWRAGAETISDNFKPGQQKARQEPE